MLVKALSCCLYSHLATCAAISLHFQMHMSIRLDDSDVGLLERKYTGVIVVCNVLRVSYARLIQLIPRIITVAV